MSSAVPESHSLDWVDALDSIAEDLVRALKVPSQTDVPPPAAAPEAPAQAEQGPVTPPPVFKEGSAAAIAPVPAEPRLEPAAREGDSEVFVEATRQLCKAGAYLERLQACLEQAEQKASLATGQLAIETEVLMRYRQELAEARQRMAGWPTNAPVAFSPETQL